MASTGPSYRYYVFLWIRAALRSDLLFPLVARLIAWSIRPLNKDSKSELGLLVLDLERWWREDILELKSRVRLYALSSAMRSRIIGLFLTPEEAKALMSYEFQGKARERKNALIRYLSRLIPALARMRRFDCIVTTNHMYLQNKLIAESSARAGVPFIDMHKECMKDELVAQEFKSKYFSMGMNLSFMGSRIFVYNAFMKQFFSDLKVCSPERIAVTGSLRIDRFVNRIRNATGENTPKAVTLFSFRHLPFGAHTAAYVYQFSPDGTNGYVRLFDEVHLAFAELAAVNPSIEFVVKMKWFNVWEEYVRKAIARGGYTPEKLGNFRIVGEAENAQDLIMRSIATIGLNSTTLLETRLAGKPAVIPYFAELIDRYPDTVVFRDALEEFSVVRSAAELKAAIQGMIDHPPAFKPLSDKVTERYFGYTDGRSLDRIVRSFKEALAESRAAAR